MVRFYRLDDNTEVSMDYVVSLGVLYWKIDPINYETEGKLSAVRKERNYSYFDIVTVSPDRLPNYEAKIKSFYEEHLHTDEEIRFFLEGSGFFDVRGLKDEWIRIAANAGDMITLPAGIYHRFSTDEKNYAKVMRLFQGDPVWTAHNRDPAVDKLSARLKYLQLYCTDVSPLMTKISVSSPTNFEDVVSGLKNKYVFLFLRSASDKGTDLPSGIPCQRALPIVVATLSANCTDPFTLVDCEVSTGFASNPDHPYITNHNIKLSVLPTLLFWGTERKLEGSVLHDEGTVKGFVKSVFTE